MVSLIIIQIVCAVFVKIGVRKVDRFIYTFVNNLKNPPKRKGNSIKFHPKSQENKNNKEKNNNDNDIISKASKDIIINDITPKDNKEKNEKNEKINVNNNKGIKDLKLNSIINKVNKINDNYISRNDNYKFLKQSSLISTSSLLKTKDKYTLVKKGSIPYSTQCSNIISKDKSNSPNTSGSELNIFNINNSNNSNSSSGSDGEEKDMRINSGTGDHALYKVEEFNINNEKYENNGEDKKEIEVEKNLNINKIDKGKKRFSTQFNIKDNRNSSIIFENGYVFENGMSSGTVRDNIPINDLGFEGDKNIAIYPGKKKQNIKSNLHNDKEINKAKRRSEEINLKHDINLLRKQIKQEIISEIKEHKKQRKELERIKSLTMVPYEHKEYDEKQLNELDYEEAVIYDKRNFCKMLWYSLKEKQTLINTFFSPNNLKPFPMKLLVLIFSFSCYFVINGFLYNEEYVSTKLESSENKSFYEYISVQYRKKD